MGLTGQMEVPRVPVLRVVVRVVDLQLDGGLASFLSVLCEAGDAPGAVTFDEVLFMRQVDGGLASTWHFQIPISFFKVRPPSSF
jgi:hypothetical protein